MLGVPAENRSEFGSHHLHQGAHKHLYVTPALGVLIFSSTFQGYLHACACVCVSACMYVRTSQKH